MLKAIRRCAVAASLALVLAPSISYAHTYVYYDRAGHRHYTHDQRYAANYHSQRHYVRSCKSSATKGTIIGGIGGAVVGQAIGHNTVGTVLGAGAGALAGHQIGKSHCESR